jgi:hypothetical protein
MHRVHTSSTCTPQRTDTQYPVQRIVLYATSTRSLHEIHVIVSLRMLKPLTYTTYITIYYAYILCITIYYVYGTAVNCACLDKVQVPA